MVVPPVLIVLFILAMYLISSLKILAEYERGVIFRLGKLLPRPKGPGVILVFAPSIAWSASACARSRSRCRRRT
jgi:regulator of protease activity HflC (stomatin/prohibitin superfamily)